MEDLNLTDSPVKRAGGARQGRRAGQENVERGSPDSDLVGGASPLRNRPMTGDILLDDGPRRPRASAPPRRTGGWGEETRAKTARPLFSDPAEEAQHSDDELPIIPDLEEVEQEDLALKVAAAPSGAVNRVSTYKELDSDLFKHAAFATLEEIDLRLLTRCMEAEPGLREADELWNWDILFTEVASQMQSEWFPAEKDEQTKTATERPFTAFNRFPV